MAETTSQEPSSEYESKAKQAYLEFIDRKYALDFLNEIQEELWAKARNAPRW